MTACIGQWRDAMDAHTCTLGTELHSNETADQSGRVSAFIAGKHIHSFVATLVKSTSTKKSTPGDGSLCTIFEMYDKQEVWDKTDPSNHFGLRARKRSLGATHAGSSGLQLLS